MEEAWVLLLGAGPDSGFTEMAWSRELDREERKKLVLTIVAGTLVRVPMWTAESGNCREMA
jgi:hypothetical protein